MEVTVNRTKPVEPPVKDVVIVLTAREAALLKQIVGNNDGASITNWVNSYGNFNQPSREEFKDFSGNLYYKLPSEQKV